MDPYVTVETLDQKTLAWLEEIAPTNTHIMRLNPERAGLMVIDMQQFFLDPASPAYTSGGTAILANLERLIAAFRAAERPVIYTRHVHHPHGIDAGIMGWWWEGMCVEGTPESEIHPRLAPLEGEKVVQKHRYSAFYNTDLETVLRGLRVEDLVISGVMTNMCCESTARDAYYRDLRVFFLVDGTGAADEDMHLASLLNLAYGFAYVTRVDRIIERL
jgi:nicotinamidase-related amidase